MARVSSFVFCDSVQVQQTPEGTQFWQIINPLQVLSPYAIPGAFSFAFSCGVNEFDTDEDNVLNIQFSDPEGTVLNDSGSINIPAFPEGLGHLPKSFRSIMFNVDFRNLPIKHRGLYSLAINMNGEQIGEFKIPAFQSEQGI